MSFNAIRVIYYLRIDSSLCCYICFYVIVTGHGIFGLMEVRVEILVFTFFESLMCLKYTGKILDLLSKKSQSYERLNDVAFYEIFGRIYHTCSLQMLQCSRTYSEVM